MVSQRPSELDVSVLSQCNTVLALRMTNLRDQEFLRGILTDDASGLLDFLPALGDAEAIVAGQAVPVPLRLRFPELPPEHRPRSSAASFSRAWTNAHQDDAFVGEVVRLWRRQYR
jgi:DNA helicase HerA-like ATPase